MTTTQLLTASQEAALAAAVEVGVLAEEALRGGFAVDACPDELDVLVLEGRAAKDRLLLANTGLVKAIARGEFGASPMEFAEVVQEGFLAMAEAVVRYATGEAGSDRTPQRGSVPASVGRSRLSAADRACRLETWRDTSRSAGRRPT